MSRRRGPLAALAVTAMVVLISACGSTAPAETASGGSGDSGGASSTATDHEKAVRFAECMRHNGVSAFPDPTPNGPLIDTNRIPSLAAKDPRSDPELQAAMHKCSDFAAAAGVVRQ